MTIKTRNKATLILLFFSLSALIANTIIFIHMVRTNSLTVPLSTGNKVFGIFFENKFTFTTSIISIFIFLVYVSSCLMYLVIAFGKTQSIEIIFFSLFLIGCLTECVRILIPILNLWNSFTPIAIFCGRAVIFGRTLAPLSILSVAIVSGNSQRQNVERNIAIVVIISIIMANYIPLNNIHISLQCIIPWGKETLFSTACFLILLVANISQIINVYILEREIKSYIWFAIVCAGYMVLCITFSILTLIAGSILLIGGTIFYLNNLHDEYVWS